MPSENLRLISWNVNGLRALWKKGFPDILGSLDPDVLGIQETKLQEAQLAPAMREVPGYADYWSHAEHRKGYSGVGVYTRLSPDRVSTGIGRPEFDREGRILRLDFGDLTLFNIYFPNGGTGDERLRYKLDFYEAFFEYADGLRADRPHLIVSGDFNTAHNEIDLKNPGANRKTSGFMDIEREWMDRIVQRGYVDTFRHFHPDAVKYSWWSYRFRARERNAGWRLDYFFVTEALMDSGRVRNAFIDNEVMGSDHCPVGLELAR
jgi:exodeoxyribonuclease III